MDNPETQAPIGEETVQPLVEAGLPTEIQLSGEESQILTEEVDFPKKQAWNQAWIDKVSRWGTAEVKVANENQSVFGHLIKHLGEIAGKSVISYTYWDIEGCPNSSVVFDGTEWVGGPDERYFRFCIERGIHPLEAKVAWEDHEAAEKLAAAEKSARRKQLLFEHGLDDESIRLRRDQLLSEHNLESSLE